jgi:hypothetical protein
VVFGPIRRAVQAGKFKLNVYVIDAAFGIGATRGHWYMMDAIDGASSVWPMQIMWAERRECHDTWDYFYSRLVKACPALVLLPLITISDKNPGIIEAVKKYLPNATHQTCGWHHAKQVGPKYGAKMKGYCWSFMRLPDNQAKEEQVREGGRKGGGCFSCAVTCRALRIFRADPPTATEAEG